MKFWIIVFVMFSLSYYPCYGNDVINVGIAAQYLSQTEMEIMRNVTRQVEIKKSTSMKINLYFLTCAKDNEFIKLGNEIQNKKTTLLVSLGCAEKFVSFMQLLKLPIISTSSGGYSGNDNRNEAGRMKWREPRSVAFSKIINEVLERQDWYEIVVLYDADDVNSFKDYMDLTWKIGQRKGYPIQISDNGSLTGSAKAKLDIFGNFSIHAVILMCKERHVQPIVNTIRTVNKSHARIVPSLILHNPISSHTLENVLESQTVIGLRVNYTLNKNMATDNSLPSKLLREDTMKILLSNAVYSIAEGLLNCAASLAKNESLKDKLYENMTKCIKQAGDEFHFEILNLRNNTFEQIGTATNDGGEVKLWSLIKQNLVQENLNFNLKRPLRVVTIHDPPFVWIEKTSNGSKIYRGFLIDILKAIQQSVKFEYTIYEIEDDEYGSFDDGKWIGMVGDVFYDKADLGLAPFTVDEIRSKIITFVQPFMKANVAYLMKRPVTTKTSITQFLEPFTTNVWLTILTSIFVVTLSIYFVDFVGPHGWRKWRERKEGKPGQEFSLFNSLWFTMGCILRQGTFVTPKSFPSRFLIAIFWFIVLIQMSSYTANLAAYFTVKKSFNEIQDLETLAKMDYNILIFKHSVIHTQLQTSTYQPHQMIYEKIEAHNAFVHYFEEGMAQIRNSTEKTTILLSESPFLEDLANKKPCDLVAVNSFLPVRSYAFVVPFNSPLYDLFSIEIIKLQDSGFIEVRRKNYWEDANQCADNVDYSGNDYGRITAEQMTGVYAVLLGGIVVAGATLILEILWKHYEIIRKNAKKNLVTEFKQSNESTKPNTDQMFESSFINTYGECITTEKT